MCNVRKSPDKITEFISVNKKEDVATSVVAIIVLKNSTAMGNTRCLLQREIHV
jgi:hypothetical protein